MPSFSPSLLQTRSPSPGGTQTRPGSDCIQCCGLDPASVGPQKGVWWEDPILSYCRDVVLKYPTNSLSGGSWKRAIKKAIRKLVEIKVWPAKLASSLILCPCNMQLHHGPHKDRDQHIRPGTADQADEHDHWLQHHCSSHHPQGLGEAAGAGVALQLPAHGRAQA